MEQTLFSRQQLAERWGYETTKAIEEMERAGALTRVPAINNSTGGIRYHISQVEKVEQEGLEINPLSPLERRRLEKRIEALEKEKELLYEKLNSIKIAGGF